MKNQYQAFGDNPVCNLDPNGTEALTYSTAPDGTPTCTAPAPGPGGTVALGFYYGGGALAIAGVEMGWANAIMLAISIAQNLYDKCPDSDSSNPPVIAGVTPRPVDISKLTPPDTRPFADSAKLARHGPFDWNKYTPIIVEQDGSRMTIQDGMTRVENAGRAGIKSLPAYIFPRR